MAERPRHRDQFGPALRLRGFGRDRFEQRLEFAEGTIRRPRCVLVRPGPARAGRAVPGGRGRSQSEAFSTRPGRSSSLSVPRGRGHQGERRGVERAADLDAGRAGGHSGDGVGSHRVSRGEITGQAEAPNGHRPAGPRPGGPRNGDRPGGASLAFRIAPASRENDVSTDGQRLAIDELRESLRRGGGRGPRPGIEAGQSPLRTTSRTFDGDPPLVVIERENPVVSGFEVAFEDLDAVQVDLDRSADERELELVPLASFERQGRRPSAAGGLVDRGSSAGRPETSRSGPSVIQWRRTPPGSIRKARRPRAGWTVDGVGLVEELVGDRLARSDRPVVGEPALRGGFAAGVGDASAEDLAVDGRPVLVEGRGLRGRAERRGPEAGRRGRGRDEGRDSS